MHHTVAYTESIANAANSDLDALADGIVSIRNGHFVFPENRNLLAAWCAGATLQRARLNSPSNRVITRPYFRPIMQGAIPGAEPRVADYRLNPFLLRGDEEQAIDWTQTSAGAERATALLHVDFGRVPMPAGNVFAWRATSTTAAVANAWTLVTLTFDDNLPQGRYAVVGLEHQSTNAQCARLIFFGQQERPGGVSIVTMGGKTSDIFLPGGMGVWGYFTAVYSPNIEVLCNAADAAHEFVIHLIRVG